MQITTKFSIGDVVWTARVCESYEQAQCDECLGSKQWKCITPAGSTFMVQCAECYALSQRRVFTPNVERVTIGSVRTDTRDSSPVRYMCVETGIGSGTVWGEEKLFCTEDEAQAAAEILALRAREHYALMEKNRTAERKKSVRSISKVKA